MRPSRWLLVPSLLLTLAACKKAPPAERFLAGDTSLAVVVPSLDAFATQSASVLDTVATFPGGQGVNDVRAVAESRLGFDVFDGGSLAKAGFDRKRGAAIGIRMNERGQPEMVAALPARDAGELGKVLDAMAKEKLQFQTRTVEKGDHDVVVWSPAEGAPGMFAYAFAEKIAVVGFGPGALELVRAALAVPKDGHLGTKAEYKAALAAVGPDQAIAFYISPDAPFLKMPQLAQLSEMVKRGVAMGLSGAKDRLAFSVGMPLADDSPFLNMGSADSGPLVSRLDPSAGLVMRSNTDASTTAQMQKKALNEMLAEIGAPGAFAAALGDALDNVGGGSAMGFGVVPVAPGAPSLRDAPLAYFRVEFLVGIKDPARMKEALKTLGQEGAKEGGKPVDLSGDGPWTFPAAGGEVGVAVEDKQLLLAAGPAGSLKALTGRSGSAFKAPTATSAKAFESPMGGMYIDVPKLAAGLKVIPAASYGDDPAGTVLHSNVQNVAGVLSRFTAVSVSNDVKDKTLRGQLVIEVAPLPAK
jgi:hypothetical protein